MTTTTTGCHDTRLSYCCFKFILKICVCKIWKDFCFDIFRLNQIAPIRFIDSFYADVCCCGCCCYEHVNKRRLFIRVIVLLVDSLIDCVLEECVIESVLSHIHVECLFLLCFFRLCEHKCVIRNAKAFRAGWIDFWSLSFSIITSPLWTYQELWRGLL